MCCLNVVFKCGFDLSFNQPCIALSALQCCPVERSDLETKWNIDGTCSMAVMDPDKGGLQSSSSPTSKQQHQQRVQAASAVARPPPPRVATSAGDAPAPTPATGAISAVSYYHLIRSSSYMIHHDVRIISMMTSVTCICKATLSVSNYAPRYFAANSNHFVAGHCSHFISNCSELQIVLYCIGIGSKLASAPIGAWQCVPVIAPTSTDRPHFAALCQVHCTSTLPSKLHKYTAQCTSLCTSMHTTIHCTEQECTVCTDCTLHHTWLYHTDRTALCGDELVCCCDNWQQGSVSQHFGATEQQWQYRHKHRH